jgi:hypothetical protein
MSDIELQRMVAAHEEAISTLKSDVGEIKTDLREALKRWPPGLATAVTVLCSFATGLAVYLLTH